jgi:hypothetical protein
MAQPCSIVEVVMHLITPLLTLLLTNPVSGFAGDNCDTAIAVQPGTNFFNTTTYDDGTLPVEGNCTYMGEMSRDIWMSYTPEADGLVSLSTCASGSFDTSIMVYRNLQCSCDVLTYIACNGDAENDPACQAYHSEVDFIASGGSEYLFRIGGYSPDEGGTGLLTLSVEPQENPCACPADTNDEGLVNTDDLLTVIAGWGQSGSSGDLDFDCNVGVSDLLIVISHWGPCSTSYIFNNTFELPEPPDVITDGIFAIWWDSQFDHTADAPIMFKQLNAIRDDCLNNLGMQDPPNPESCFYYNVYIHHGANDGFPNGWANGQGTDSNGMPFLTLPAGLNTDPANTYHEGFHIFQYQASSPGYSYAGDSQWYTETAAQWYAAWNMPGYMNAFIEAGAITANPQLALWHSFSNEAPGDPTDWYYQVRQYGMHTLLHYLVEEEQVEPAILTNGFYAGTELSPQEYIKNQIGDDTFRTMFANWAAHNTGGLDYLTPEQVERALAEAEWVGDPDNSHPYIAVIDDVEIIDQWIFEPCIDSPPVDPTCFAPRSWAYNVIRITNSHAARYTLSIDGDANGTEGAPSHFMGRVVVMSADGPVYSALDMTDPLHGSGTVDVTNTDSDVFLVIVSVPEQFSGYQRYGYRAMVQRGPPAP